MWSLVYFMYILKCSCFGEIRRCRNLGDPISFIFCSCCKYDIERDRVELHLSACISLVSIVIVLYAYILGVSDSFVI